MQEAHNAGFCFGLVTGIADNINSDDGADLTNASHDQLIRVVQKYLEDHPEQLSKAGSWLIQQALIKAFPKPK